MAIDPGKVSHRVWFGIGDAGLLDEPRSELVLRPGREHGPGTIRRRAGAELPVVAIEATCALHGSWTRAFELQFPLSVRVFAP